MPSPNLLESADTWELEEKLRHAKRVLNLPIPGGPAAGVDHWRAVEWVCWFAAKATAASLSCAAVLLLWAMFHSRADLVGPAIGAAGAALAAWPISRLTPTSPAAC